MYRLLAVILLAGPLSAQTAPQPLQVSRQFGVTSKSEVFDNRSINRQCNAFGYLVTGNGGGLWSVQLEYADISANGPWTPFPTGAVTGLSTTLVGGGYGFHQWVRLNTTSGSTIATLSCSRDYFLPPGEGGSGPGTGTVSLFTGSASINPGIIQDGVLQTAPTTIPITGATLGDFVQVYTALPSGIEIFGDVTSTNTVTVRLLNLSGSTYAPGSIVIGAMVLHVAAGGGGSVSKLAGTATFDPGTVVDGAMPIQGTTISIVGASIGDLVYVSSRTLPSGVLIFGDVTSANTVTMRLLNASGSSYSPGVEAFPVTVIHYIPGGTGGAASISGAAAFSPGSIVDGTAPILSTTATVLGASIGDPIAVSSNSFLPSGIRIFGDVTSTNTVTLRLLDMSGSSYSPGVTVFNVLAWH